MGEDLNASRKAVTGYVVSSPAPILTGTHALYVPFLTLKQGGPSSGKAVFSLWLDGQQEEDDNGNDVVIDQRRITVVAEDERGHNEPGRQRKVQETHIAGALPNSDNGERGDQWTHNVRVVSDPLAESEHRWRYHHPDAKRCHNPLRPHACC